MIEVGKTYEFKTVTFYFIGTVTRLLPTHAELKNVVQVFDTGPNADYYGKGKIQQSERMPDGVLVPLGGGTLIVPYEHVVVGGFSA